MEYFSIIWLLLGIASAVYIIMGEGSLKHIFEDIGNIFVLCIIIILGPITGVLMLLYTFFDSKHG